MHIPASRAAAALPLALLVSPLARGAEAPQATSLPGVSVSAQAAPDLTPAFPATQVTVTAEQSQATTNALDVEDMAKYLPSVFIRKRNYGDTQPVLATRTWGVNSSARSLVYVDDIPISALIANNNTLGAPRWGVVSPEQIDHIDMLYGPFSAAYPGNAMGGVMRLVTRAPEQTQVTLKQSVAVQDVDLYGTHKNLSTSQTSLSAGGRSGKLAWFLGLDAQNSFSQPLSVITAGKPPAGSSGAIPALNKTGQVADVLGAGGLLHTRMLNLDGKFSYQFTPGLRLTYLVGYWSNHGRSDTQSYLRDAAGRPSFGGASAFASNTYDLSAHHLMQGLSLATDTRGAVDGEVVLTHYAMIKDQQLGPAGVLGGTAFTPNGLLTDLGGTNWTTLDLKGVWRPQGYGGPNQVSAGLHGDEYVLDNPTWRTAANDDPDTVDGLYTAGRGRTRTYALWLEDAWRFAPGWLLTLGGRYERWRASDGFNFSGATAVRQPVATADAFSPKLSLQWDLAPRWRITGSLAKAVRFPTVGELYQLVSTGATFSVPDPDLKPERVRSGELAVEHSLDEGQLRLSLFQENTRDALIAQTSFLATSPVPVSFTSNVGEVRNRGLELAAQKNHVLVQGLELSGSVTFVDSTILSDPGFASAAGTTAKGKHAPYVPRWRATAVATYRPDPRWAFTLAGRYSGKQYSTLDNTDSVAHVFGAFDSFVVFDARANYQITDRLGVAAGIDNFTHRKYFLYHPFPQRTFIAELKLSL